MRRPLEARLLDNLVKNHESGCWLYNKKLRRDGYANFKDDQFRQQLAHRVAYELFCGPIPSGMYVVQTCEVRSCCNPSHLTTSSVVRYGEDPPEVRLLDGLVRNPVTGCWVWTGSKLRKGYGNLWVIDRIVRAHRYSYTLFCGSIPDGMKVLHSCDNPPCCRPDHLFLGNDLDNARDRDSKGRGFWQENAPSKVKVNNE